MPELRENAHLSKLLETRFGLQFVQYENWRIPDGRYCSILYDSYRRPHRRAAPPRTGEGVSSTDVGSLRHLAGAYRYFDALVPAARQGGRYRGYVASWPERRRNPINIALT